MDMGRRPTSSEPGAQKGGPNAKPKRKTVNMRFPTSCPTRNSCVMVGIEEEGAEQVKVLSGGRAY